MTGTGKSSEIRVDYFLVGVPKSASTWIYQCCQGHPELVTPTGDSLKFYDLKYHKGTAWYAQQFQNYDPNKVVIDPSPTYFRSPGAPSRIAQDFPEAKFILSLRNPVDRAFSQFWHEKKNGDFTYEFEDCLDKFLLYSWYIDTGMYADLLDRWLRYFDLSRFHVVLFDDLRADPAAFIRDIFTTMGVDADYQPPVLNEKVNAAGGQATAVSKKLDALKKYPAIYEVLRSVKRSVKLGDGAQRALGIKGSNEAYQRGMSDELRAELQTIYNPQLDRLEALLDIDLSNWR